MPFHTVLLTLAVFQRAFTVYIPHAVSAFVRANHVQSLLLPRSQRADNSLCGNQDLLWLIISGGDNVN